MKQENIIQSKSYPFAIKVVNLYRYLIDEKWEYVLSNNYCVPELQLVQMWKKELVRNHLKIFSQN